MIEKGNPWKKVVTIKYGEGAFGWAPTLPYGSYGHNLWTHIAKGWERFHFSFEVGDGSTVFFL